MVFATAARQKSFVTWAEQQRYSQVEHWARVEWKDPVAGAYSHHVDGWCQGSVDAGGVLGTPYRRGLEEAEPRWASIIVEAVEEARSDLLTALKVGGGGLEVRRDGRAEGANGVDKCRQPWTGAGLRCGWSKGCLGGLQASKCSKRELA